MKRWLVTAALAACVAGTYAWAQKDQGTAIILPQSNSAPQMPVQTSMGPVNFAAANDHDVRVNTMANDTFVVVKDVTDSQIVFVYRVDQLGKVTLADKKRFYY